MQFCSARGDIVDGTWNERSRFRFERQPCISPRKRVRLRTCVQGRLEGGHRHRCPAELADAANDAAEEKFGATRKPIYVNVVVTTIDCDTFDLNGDGRVPS